MTNTVTRQLQTLPTDPGVYLFRDEKGNVLYVGKAKQLKTRVQSYFRESADLDPAKQDMVQQVEAIETIVTSSENEALILEANLIREHRPPYNVVLMDDKYYLLIKITNEEYPRVFPVRKIKRDGAQYFGPYSSASSVRRTLKLLQRLFPHRGEKDNPREKIFPHALFGSHEGTTDSLSRKEYAQNIKSIVRFLKGDRDQIITTLRRGMQQAAKEKSFERAALFRDQLQSLERLEGNQSVHLPRRESFDAIGIARDGARSAATVLRVRKGKLIGKDTFLLKHRANSDPRDVLRQYLLQYYSVSSATESGTPRLIYVPLPLPDAGELSQWINTDQPPELKNPQRGIKRKILRLAEQNAQQLLREEQVDFAQDARLKRAAEELQRALRIERPLKRIETYDVSNIQGSLATASMVVFVDGAPDTSQYRKFKLELTETPNDFAMLQEALRRRFSGRHEEWPLPDLVLIDGGKGQLSSALATLNDLGVTTPVASVAKRLEELFIPNTSEPIRLPYDSDALYLVQRMRDEAHRFTISYHRLLRSKKHTKSLLDEVPGIGPKTKKQLLARFGSLRGIRAATDEELAEIIGTKVSTLRDYLG